MILIKSINGKPETDAPVGYGSHFDGEYYYYFSNEQEHNTFLESLPKSTVNEVENTPQIGIALNALMLATPEEIEQIRIFLGIK